MYLKRFEEIQRKLFGGLIDKKTTAKDKKAAFLMSKGGNQTKGQFRSLRGSVESKADNASRSSSKNKQLWAKLMIKDL